MPNYTNTGLARGTTYYYVVSVVNGNWQSAPSGPVSALPFAPSLGVRLNADDGQFSSSDRIK